MNLLTAFVEKFLCQHQWEHKNTTREWYSTNTDAKKPNVLYYIYFCSKCGKIKVIKI